MVFTKKKNENNQLHSSDRKFHGRICGRGPALSGKKGILPVAIKTATIVVQNMVNIGVLAALGDLYYCYFIQSKQNLPDHLSYKIEFNLSSAILREVGSCCRAEHLNTTCKPSNSRWALRIRNGISGVNEVFSVFM